ncbi:MAG: [protein-PII] uridylyltransferase [Actinomycetota bacterium]
MARSGEPLLVAPELSGRAYAEAHSDATDLWLRTVFDRSVGGTPGLTLAAVGGYGRRELCPYSDIDVILIHDDLDNIGDLAEAIWYPVWDRKLKMGHAVFTLAQAEELAREDLHTATSFLATRLIAGDHRLLTRLDDITARVWAEVDTDLIGRLAVAVEERHEKHGETAFNVEPDLKEGRGGLRDVHALGWAARAVPGFADGVVMALDDEVDQLLAARVELHRLAGRSGDVLNFDAQDDVAAALSDPSSHELMMRLSFAARRIAWYSDEAWERWTRSSGRAEPDAPLDRPMSTEFGLVDGRIELSDRVDVGADPLAVLRLAATAARSRRTMGRRSLVRLRDHGATLPEPWPREARELFAELFLAGRAAIGVVEDLDQYGLMERILPEWEAVRCHPQRNVMHTFTVDRHLCEAAANAAALADRVVRPDLLVVGALFHDIGKGFPPRDHTEVGMEIITTMATRMGYSDNDIGVLVDLCRHHLLLPDVATRRDLSDAGTINAVAAAVDSVEFLGLLAALTEADSIATGPAVWGTWKAGLLAELVERTEFVLRGGAVSEVAVSEFPSAEVRELMAARESVLKGSGTTLTVVADDQPMLFSRMAGVLAVNGLDVLTAEAYSDPDGMATCEFTLQPPATHTVDWDKIVSVAERALAGRVALTARVHQRAHNYERYRRRLSAVPPRLDVVIDNDISEAATVVEVHAEDTVGLLFWITQALGELRLDIRSAKVQTFGPQAVDSFYVSDSDGAKIGDAEILAELDLAIRQAIATGPGAVA